MMMSRLALAAFAASVVATPLAAQAATPEKPTQFIAVGGTGQSANDNTNGGISGSYGATVKRFYANVGLNYFSKQGTTWLDGDYQFGYAFFRQVDATRNARHVFAITGGYYDPQNGKGSLMAALNGFSGKHSTPITLNAMVGYVFPEAGDPVLMVRGGLGWIF